MFPPEYELLLTDGFSSPDLAGVGEKWEPSEIREHVLVPPLKKGYRHSGLPVQRHCPQVSGDVAEMCQPNQYPEPLIKNSVS